MTPATGKVRLAVRDSGAEVTDDLLARLTERFYRVDRSGNLPGHSLCRSIVDAIAKLHR